MQGYCADPALFPAPEAVAALHDEAIHLKIA
jgi:hypothetical protein